LTQREHQHHREREDLAQPSQDSLWPLYYLAIPDAYTKHLEYGGPWGIFPCATWPISLPPSGYFGRSGEMYAGRSYGGRLGDWEAALRGRGLLLTDLESFPSATPRRAGDVQAETSLHQVDSLRLLEVGGGAPQYAPSRRTTAPKVRSMILTSNESDQFSM
jgi:hypothetical protein